MLELFDTLSSYLNKIHDFFAVIWDKIVETWETIQIATGFLPLPLVGVFVVSVVLIIIMRVIGR